MIATNYEQSRKLLDAGISENTADMHWHFPLIENNVSGYLVAEKPDLYFGQRCWIYQKDVPAWSMSALWDLCKDYPLSFATTKDNSENVINFLVEHLIKKHNQ